MNKGIKVGLVLITGVVLIVLFGIASSQAGARQAASASTAVIDVGEVIGGYPPTLPAFRPSLQTPVTNCVTSALVCLAEAELWQDPPSGPFGVTAISDSVPFELTPVRTITIGKECWLYQPFAGDGELYAIYRARCETPQEVMRIR